MESILKVYLDTSVFGGLVDLEPEIHLEASKMLFYKIREGIIIGFISDLTIRELERAPEKIRKIFQEYIGIMSRINENDESKSLAEEYILRGVFSRNQEADARHVSVSIVNRITTLISWNFQHLVNISRCRKINSIHLLKGYPSVEIISPLEVRYETEN